MNRENVQTWVDELMFGDHIQTYGNLHNRYVRVTMPELRMETYDAHCALGVADLIRPVWFLADYKGPLTDVIVAWLGLTDDQAQVILDLNDTKMKSLSEIGVWVRDNWLKEE